MLLKEPQIIYFVFCVLLYLPPDDLRCFYWKQQSYRISIYTCTGLHLREMCHVKIQYLHWYSLKTVQWWLWTFVYESFVIHKGLLQGPCSTGMVGIRARVSHRAAPWWQLGLWACVYKQKHLLVCLLCIGGCWVDSAADGCPYILPCVTGRPDKHQYPNEFRSGPCASVQTSFGMQMKSLNKANPSEQSNLQAAPFEGTELHSGLTWSKTQEGNELLSRLWLSVIINKSKAGGRTKQEMTCVL